MRHLLLCTLFVLLSVAASASASAGPASIVENPFEGYAPKGESRITEISVLDNASELFIEILSISGESVSFELKDPRGAITEEGRGDHLTMKVNRPEPGLWTLKVTGQGDSSNRYVGLATIASGEAFNTVDGVVNENEMEPLDIEVGADVSSLSLDFKTLSEDDLTVDLYSPRGKEVWSATSHRTDEVRSKTVDYPMLGIWVAEVRGTNVKESGGFEIAWTELSGHQKRPAGEGVVDLGAGGDFSGQVVDGEICTYSLEIPTGAGQLSLGLSSLTDDDLLATLYSPLGEEVWSRTSKSPDEPASVMVTFPMAGVWTIEVLGSWVKSSGRYSGWVEVLDGPFPISSGPEIITDLVIGAVGDEEVGSEYSLSVPEKTTRLEMEFRTLSEDDLKIVLFTPEMEEIWSATSTGLDQIRSKTVASPMPGVWTVGVLGPGLKKSGLFLAEVTLSPVGLPPAPSTLQFSGDISRGDVLDHSMTIPEDVEMLFVYAVRRGGGLELRLKNPGGIEVEETTSGILTVAAPLPGTWTLEAVGTEGEGPDSYQISVWMALPVQPNYGSLSAPN